MRQSPATIRDVARVAELSVASVSRVLNGHSNVQPDTRERVLSAVSDLGYVPNAAARSLSTARSDAIGVVLPDLHGEFFSELVRGLDKAASERGYMLLLSTMHASSELASQAIGAMRGRVDGLIVMAPQIGAADMGYALPVGVPTVLVNSRDELGRHTLRVDNRAGVRAMVRHLLDTGRQAIVHIAGMADNLDGAERRDAYLAAMAEMAPSLPTRVLDGDFSEGAGERLTRQLLDEGAAFDAIFAANDMMALGAVMALRGAGIAVAGRVAVAGFDDVPLARYLALSTLRVDVAGVGERAIARLVDEIQGIAGPATLELQAPQLMVRATTASVAG
ncbi:MAG: LacI family DNA-binding transcriptional regulator [Sphingopyxis sp.]